MRGKTNKDIVIILSYILCFTCFLTQYSVFKCIAQEFNGKELNGNIQNIIKHGVGKIITDPTGSEYYDSLLKEYSRHIAAIKPFDYKKIKNYLDFINRNLNPYYLKLNFLCNGNKKEYKNGNSTCTGVLSLKEKRIGGKLRVQTDWKKKDKTKPNKDWASKEYLLGNYISLKYKDLGVDNSNVLFKVNDNGSDDYKYTIKYTKSFQIQPTSIVNASIAHNNIDYLSEVHELDIINRLDNTEYEVYRTHYNYKPSNLLLELRYKLLCDNAIEYSVGYVNRYTKYSHLKTHPIADIDETLGKETNYNINHVYFVTKILNLGLTFYAGYEYDFHHKNKHITGAIFYKKTFYDYFIDISFLHSNREWENKEGNTFINNRKVSDSYIASRIGKKIEIKNDFIKNIQPYITILQDYKHRKKAGKTEIDKKKEKNLQKGVGAVIVPSLKNLRDLEADLFYLQDKRDKSVILSLKLKF